MHDYLDIEIKHADLEIPLRWDHLFANSNQVDMEIGFGKCGFLLNIAVQQPSSNFVGIEFSRKYYRKGIAKIQKAGIRNVKLLWGEAFHLVHTYIADHSIANVYINFPDPWPKKRHAKRRLIQPAFAVMLAQKLASGGCIEIATDAESYMQDIRHIFEKIETYRVVYDVTSGQSVPLRQHRSDYEEIFLKEGKVIHYAKYQKQQAETVAL